MQQAYDFLTECETLSSIIEAKCNGRWDAPTQFKNWTVNDVLVHLHLWNMVADFSLTDEAKFDEIIGQIFQGIHASGLRGFENGYIEARGEELHNIWQKKYRDMAERWSSVDPKVRLKWVGPTMSARSSITARQMETWAHGHEVFDLFGETRAESDRIKNIVILGVNTFGFSYQIRKKTVPDNMPKLELTSPSGEVWTFGDGQDKITGRAVEFAQVVTQTRNYMDTNLVVQGAMAEDWMANAQCFAGPPETPPEMGKRFKT